jgi:type I restriction enzyme S subunit
LRPKYETVLPYFLNLNLQTESYWKQVERGTSGSAQGGFNASKLKSLFVNLPPIAEQERIVEIVSSMDDVIQTTEQAVAEAKVLRTTLLNQEIS